MAHNEWNKVVLGKSGRKRSSKSLLKKSGGRKKIFKTSKAKHGSIRQIKRCLFRQIKTGLSEHLTMG